MTEESYIGRYGPRLIGFASRAWINVDSWTVTCGGFQPIITPNSIFGLGYVKFPQKGIMIRRSIGSKNSGVEIIAFFIFWLYVLYNDELYFLLFFQESQSSGGRLLYKNLKCN